MFKIILSKLYKVSKETHKVNLPNVKMTFTPKNSNSNQTFSMWHIQKEKREPFEYVNDLV